MRNRLRTSVDSTDDQDRSVCTVLSGQVPTQSVESDRAPTRRGVAMIL